MAVDFDHQSRITGVVLAGGRARRMGGVDKGLINLSGRPMIEYILEALGPQVDAVLINANRNIEQYARFGHEVVADAYPNYAGPLAGMASCMTRVETELMLTVPCDSPFIPQTLAARLLARLAAEDAEICIAHDGERPQPVFALMQTRLLDSLDRFLEGGGRKIDIWYAGHRTVNADFADQPDAFVNVNTPEDVLDVEPRLNRNGGDD